METSNRILRDPRISVVMSVYNEPLKWISQSIDSILNQTFSDFEFIIINDKPDRSELSAFLENYAQKDKRIKLITNPTNLGLTKSLNIGLRQSKGEYIARMDADDISMPKRFEKQVAFMDSHPDVIVCGTKISYFGNVPLFTYNDWIHEKDEDIKGQLISNSCFAHPTVFIRKATLVSHSIEYDEEYKQSQDYRLWEILADFGKYANLKENLLYYRISNNQVSRNYARFQLDKGLDVKRRIRAKWLCDHNIPFKDIVNINTSDIHLLIKKMRRDSSLRKSGIYFLRTYYFSRNTNKLSYFYDSIKNGVFWKFSSKDKLRYISIILNKKEPVSW